MSVKSGAYTPDEVAALLKISKHTVYELIKRGELSAFRVGNKMRIEPEELEAYKMRMKTDAPLKTAVSSMGQAGQAAHPVQMKEAVLRLAGSHDFIIEHLTRFMNESVPPVLLQSAYIGSLEGLMMLYRGATDIAAVHLYDPATKEYNLPMIKRLFIHEPITVIRLAERTQGFIVARDNPKQITSWQDLTRRDITFVNRQKGSGTRFLLDAHLVEQGILPHQINGYDHEEWSHTDTAARIAQGRADVALGIEAAARKLGLSFVPLARECFDLVLFWRDENREALTRFCDVIRSDPFKASLHHLEGYHFDGLGQIIYHNPPRRPPLLNEV
jgi:putative molybdopterin biosynthesis protein